MGQTESKVEQGGQGEVSYYYHQQQQQQQQQILQQQQQYQYQQQQNSITQSSSSSSSSLVYQEVPYTSYSVDKPASKHNQQQVNNTNNTNITNNITTTTTTTTASTSIKDEIITIHKADSIRDQEPELERLSKTPQFFPLLNDDNDSWFNPTSNPLRVADMDGRGALNVSIDIQNYLKNSTGYIFEKQLELIQKMKDVEFKQTKRLTTIMSLKTQDATHTQIGAKEVLDKIKGNINKTKEMVVKIGDLIEQLEQILPSNERDNLHQEIEQALSGSSSNTLNQSKIQSQQQQQSTITS